MRLQLTVSALQIKLLSVLSPMFPFNLLRLPSFARSESQEGETGRFKLVTRGEYVREFGSETAVPSDE